MRGRLRLLVLILILAVVLYPLIWMVGTSVKSPEEIASNMKVIERWRAAWNKAQLDDAAWAEIAASAGTPGAQ